MGRRDVVDRRVARDGVAIGARPVAPLEARQAAPQPFDDLRVHIGRRRGIAETRAQKAQQVAAVRLDQARGRLVEISAFAGGTCARFELELGFARRHGTSA
jgi:hypothetical protein